MTDLSFDEYKLLFYSTCDNIEKSISKYNGVVCYKDGNSENKEHKNLFILHICDIMNVMTNSHNNRLTDITVRSNLLSDLKEKKVVNQFEKEYLRKENHDFFLKHIDFLYVCYAYYGNNSFVPIRTSVSQSNTDLKQASE